MKGSITSPIKSLAKWLGAAVAVPSVLVVAFFFWASSSSYPFSRYAEILSFGPATPEDSPKDSPEDSPKDSPEGGDGAEATFTVVSYNIGYLSGLTNNVAVERDRALFETNQQTAIAALADLDPDIIGFQEIDLDANRSFQVNQVDALANGLGFAYGAIAINWDKNYVPFPYWPPTAHFGRVLSGQAVLSHFPIDSNERLVLEKVPDNPFFYNALYLDRVAQVTQLTIDGQPVVVINVHLEAFDSPTRQRQTERVRTLAETYAADYPVLLIGDFNSALNRDAEGRDRSIQTLLDSPVLQAATATDQLDAIAQATYPAGQPEFKLDYIFYTPSTLELVDGGVITAAAQASDHLPVAMTFKFTAAVE